MSFVLVVIFGVLWWYTNFWLALVIIVGSIAATFGLLAVLGSKEDPSDGQLEVISRDDGEDDDGDGFEVSARMRIKYVGADGDASVREIYAYRYTDSSPGYITARCMKAKAERTFRTDRIKDAVDIETGEVIKRVPTFMRTKRVE